MRSPSPRKQPYVVIGTRVNMSRGVVSTIEDQDEGLYYVGFGLTIDNLNEGGPHGCRTYYDKEEAMTEMSYLAG